MTRKNKNPLRLQLRFKKSCVSYLSDNFCSMYFREKFDLPTNKNMRYYIYHIVSPKCLLFPGADEKSLTDVKGEEDEGAAGHTETYHRGPNLNFRIKHY